MNHSVEGNQTLISAKLTKHDVKITAAKHEEKVASVVLLFELCGKDVCERLPCDRMARRNG